MLAVIGKACDLIARNPRIARFRTKRSLQASIRDLETEMAALALLNPTRINTALLALFRAEISSTRYYLRRGALEKAQQYCAYARDTRRFVERALQPPRRRRRRVAYH